jgi:hypothetical protein
MCAKLDTKVSFLTRLCLCYVPGADDLLHCISFGIFRLTDPPGLQTILGCVLTDAFHPHPELPIYTVSAPFLIKAFVL